MVAGRRSASAIRIELRPLLPKGYGLTAKNCAFRANLLPIMLVCLETAGEELAAKRAAGLSGEFGQEFLPAPLPAIGERLRLALSQAKLPFCRKVAATTESWPLRVFAEVSRALKTAISFLILLFSPAC